MEKSKNRKEGGHAYSAQIVGDFVVRIIFIQGKNGPSPRLASQGTGRCAAPRRHTAHPFNVVELLWESSATARDSELLKPSCMPGARHHALRALYPIAAFNASCSIRGGFFASLSVNHG